MKPLSSHAVQTVGLLALSLITSLAAAPALAQDKPVELKLAHWVPAQHLLAVHGFFLLGQIG